MSKDGGGYGGYSHGDSGLSYKVASLEKKIEEYRKHIELAEKSYKEHIDVLKAKVQMNIHNSAFNGLLDENKELKQDLDKALELLSGYNEALKRENALASRIGTTADDFIKKIREGRGIR